MNETESHANPRPTFPTHGTRIGSEFTGEFVDLWGADRFLAVGQEATAYNEGEEATTLTGRHRLIISKDFQGSSGLPRS
jgi:hypothetical protein